MQCSNNFTAKHAYYLNLKYSELWKSLRLIKNFLTVRWPNQTLQFLTVLPHLPPIFLKYKVFSRTKKKNNNLQSLTNSLELNGYANHYPFVHLISVVLQEKAVRSFSCESLTLFIPVETLLRGGAEIKIVMLIFHQITRRLFKMF